MGAAGGEKRHVGQNRKAAEAAKAWAYTKELVY
jgi:hypothetical protein